MSKEYIKISKEKVLKTAEECIEAKDVFISLFPELFEDDVVFCRIGDLLIQKGEYSFYKTCIQKDCFVLYNKKHGTTLGNPVKIKDGSDITVGMFKEMISNFQQGVECFKVVKAEDVHKLYFNE